MLRELKIYVWPEFEQSIAEYPGLAVAISRTLEDAVAIIEEECNITYDVTQWGSVEVYDMRETAFVCFGRD